jgi:hypothetical protein
MPHLTLDIPEAIAEKLERLAGEQQESVEQVAVERLAVALEPSDENLAERYERFFRESGLFYQPTEEEKRRYQPLSEEELEVLARKLGEAGPLSEVIIEERGER